jgi:hypothetical protein
MLFENIAWSMHAMDSLAYFARAISYIHKIFMKLATEGTLGDTLS